MKKRIPESIMAQAAEFLTARTALQFPKDTWNLLERKMFSAAKEFGFTDVEAFMSWMLSSPLSREQIEVLASHLTITETYFWREPRVFEALEEHIIPTLLQERGRTCRNLRIWSAGCASGEEPYSIAIALRRAIPDIEDWNILILATEIGGIYGDWSFRNTPEWFKREHFLQREDVKFEILPEIRKMVIFSYLNLADDQYPSTMNNTNVMDIIFCRNVLMYFAPERAMTIGQGLSRSLVETGWLAISSTELCQHLFPDLLNMNFPGAIIYCKATPEIGMANRSSDERPMPRSTFDPPPAPPPSPLDIGLEPPISISIKRVPATKVRPPAVRTVREEGPANDGTDIIDVYHSKKPTGDADRATLVSVHELANKGHLSEALVACERAMIADRLDPGLHYLRATILQEQGRDDDAAKALKRVLYTDPDHVLAHFALGNLAFRRKDLKSAKRYFDNVLALLGKYQPDQIVPESEGLTVGRFRKIVIDSIQAGAKA